MGRLDGRVALVSGAAQGLGRAIATRLAAEGARLAVNDRRPSPELDRLAEETGGITAVADVSDPDAVRRMVAEVEQSLGPVEALAANHAYMSMQPFVEHDPEDWWRNVDVNLSGTFFLIRAVLPAMRARGGGRIVIIGSEFGVVGWANASAYAASKAGLISLTKGLGRELGPWTPRTRASRRRRSGAATPRRAQSGVSAARRKWPPWQPSSAPTPPARSWARSSSPTAARRAGSRSRRPRRAGRDRRLLGGANREKRAVLP